MTLDTGGESSWGAAGLTPRASLASNVLNRKEAKAQERQSGLLSSDDGGLSTYGGRLFHV
jgi:hypothetical protein